MTSMDSRSSSSSTSMAFRGPCSSMYRASAPQHSTTLRSADLRRTWTHQPHEIFCAAHRRGPLQASFHQAGTF